MSKMSIEDELKNQIEQLKQKMPTIAGVLSQRTSIFDYLDLVSELRGTKLTDEEKIPILKELEKEKISPQATAVREDVEKSLLIAEKIKQKQLEDEIYYHPKAVAARDEAAREAIYSRARAQKEEEIAKKEEEIALKKLKFEKLEQMQRQNELLLKQTKLQEQALSAKAPNDDLSSKMTKFMDDMANQVKGMSGKVETLCTRVNEIDHRMNNMDGRFDAIMQTLASMNLTQASTHNLLVQTTQQFSHIASTVYTPSIHGSHTEDVTSIGMSPEHDHPGN